ncbi:MAG: succinylglutamate desuccinylase/aspartoacylase family protein [Myxococcaceae bacterium]|nr:succinylglutamate desuccinylase/aspartoacylase family protein [Myxococcaceae bacterium]MCI0670331.1 succinylglutamate desuccinylase/aspartoacylase family protein [Myxococcaceae bacterium]
MRFTEYVERLSSNARGARLERYGAVVEDGREYPLLSLHTEGRRRLVLTSGFHGEEPAGPLTLLEHLPEVLAFARAWGVGLDIFPCINPSGFEAGTRYNLSNERPNNDFIRYQVAPGVWKEQVLEGEAFVGWVLFDGGPKETRALRTALHALPTPDAALDLHQDNYIHGSLTYAYVFGDAAPYLPLMQASAALVGVAASLPVDGQRSTDAQGFIRHHDGSVTDYYLRRGVPHAAALETTTRTPPHVSQEVNLIWIRGFVELAAAGGR